MPITLGCPTCAKRFRARDESVGKRVKCPYCQAAIVVTADGAAVPSAAPPRPPASAAGMSGARPVSPGDWGGDAPPEYAPLPDPMPAPKKTTGGLPRQAPSPRAVASSPRLAVGGKPNPDVKTPKQLALPHWKKTRSGLFWVLFALFFLAIPGFVEFGKMVYDRSVGKLPSGEGWVKIDGYVNTNDKDAIKVSKEEELNILLYGVPLLVGGLALSFGRMTAGAAPRASGAKGLFAFSGLFTLVGLVAILALAVCTKLLFVQAAAYLAVGYLVALLLAEVWFLTGLATVGAHLKRPAVPRAVGLFWFVAALAVAAATIGWDVYAKEVRPKPVDKDTELYEAGTRMLGCLLLVGLYWRTVSVTRRAIHEWVEVVDE